MLAASLRKITNDIWNYNLTVGIIQVSQEFTCKRSSYLFRVEILPYKKKAVGPCDLCKIFPKLQNTLKNDK